MDAVQFGLFRRNDCRIRVILQLILFYLNLIQIKSFDFFSTPMSAAAAFQYHWPFGDELCVAYAMIMSTAGCAFLFIVILNPNVIRVNNHIFHIGVNIWGY